MSVEIRRISMWITPCKRSATRGMKNLLIVIFLLAMISAYGQETPPQASIVYPLNGGAFSGEQVRVVYVVSGVEPKSAKIFVDEKGVQLLTDVVIGENTAMVDVPARDCKISVVVKNDFGESVPAAVNIIRDENIFKPSLYVLAIGVSNYDDRSLRLQYPAKDASDFTIAMIRQAGLLYESVDVRLLTDRTATTENIRDGFQWLQTQTTRRDIAMLFIAGHGINNNADDFFFMPVNADVNRILATCVGHADIKNTVSSVAGKLLVFMDACHSGNILGNNQQRSTAITKVIEELTGAESGAIVFTSSTGKQFSLESDEWNNGAFTKALVEGLTGAADLSGRSMITVKSLDYYLTNRVKELTQGKQATTTIIPVSVPDFTIAVVTTAPTVPAVAETAAETSVSNTRKKPFYLSLAAGKSAFGSVAFGETKNGGPAVFGADLAYFFTPYLAAGVKVNAGICRMNFGEDGNFNETVLFYGPALYTRLGKKRLAFIASAAAGNLHWQWSEWDALKAMPEEKTSIGGFLSAGVNYMLTPGTGIVANVQTAIGSVDTRKPAAIGATLGINFTLYKR